MGLPEEFDDRSIHAEAEEEKYHPYEYQEENNPSWAGALPVKQYVLSPSVPAPLIRHATIYEMVETDVYQGLV